MKTNKNTIIVLLIIALVVLFLYFKKDVFVSNQKYSVVYMATGEIYVGKLSTMPYFELRDGYILQVTQDSNDPTKTNFQLQPMNDAYWAPESIKLTKEQVVFYGRLKEDSRIAQVLKEQGI